MNLGCIRHIEVEALNDIIGATWCIGDANGILGLTALFDNHLIQVNFRTAEVKYDDLVRLLFDGDCTILLKGLRKTPVVYFPLAVYNPLVYIYIDGTLRRLCEVQGDLLCRVTTSHLTVVRDTILLCHVCRLLCYMASHCIDGCLDILLGVVLID